MSGGGKALESRATSQFKENVIYNFHQNWFTLYEYIFLTKLSWLDQSQSGHQMDGFHASEGIRYDQK